MMSETLYSELGDSSNRSSRGKLLRKPAIKIHRDDRKPPLPPVQENPRYSISTKKVFMNAGASVEDGTSISDDLETDTRSAVPSSSGFRHHKYHHKSIIAVPQTRINVDKQGTKLKGEAKSTIQSRKNYASDSGIFLSDIEQEHSDGSQKKWSKQEMNELPKRLHHLIDMYQNRLTTNEQIIKTCEAEVLELREDQQSVVSENNALRQVIEELKSGYPTDIEEWKVLREQAELVLKENDDLQNELHLMHSKLRENHIAHKKQITDLMHKLGISQDENSIAQAELKQLRFRFDKLREEHNMLVLQSQDQMSKDEHSQSIRDSKRLLENLKSKYEVDVEKANDFIKHLQDEKSNLVSRTTNLNSENEQLSMENGVLIATHKKDLKNMLKLRKFLARYKAKNVSLAFKVKTFHHQNISLLKEKNKLAETAFATYKDVNRLFSQIENVTANETKIKNLLINKKTVLDELQRHILRKQTPDDELQIKHLQQEINETRNKLKKLKERAEKSTL